VRASSPGAIALPVRFVEQIEAMYAAGVRTFVEVGPAGAHQPRRPRSSGRGRTKKNGVGQLFAALGRLFVAGHRQAFGALWAGYATPTDPHARPVPKMAIKVDGSNHGKPYPPRTGAKGRNAPNPVRTGFAASKGGGVVEKPVYVEKIVEKPVYVEKIVEKPVYVEANTSADPTGAFMPQHPQSPADPWVLAFQEAQRATVEAHAAYQRSMAQSHEQFLRTIEASFHGLSRMTGGGYAPAPQPQPLTLPLPQPVYTAPAPVYAPPAPAPVYAAPAPVYAAPVPAPAPPPRPAPAPAPRPAPIPAPAPAAAAVDVEKLLMEVVAEKTGYPSEMLALDMALEAISASTASSASRSCRRPRARPGPARGRRRRDGQAPDAGPDRRLPPGLAPAPVLAPPPSPTRGPRPPVVRRRLTWRSSCWTSSPRRRATPPRCSRPDMALEADLGIDSIKRVEILSAVRERAPGLPEVDAGEMAKLQTLGQIVDHIRASLPAAAADAPPPLPRPPPPRRRHRSRAPPARRRRREDRLPRRDARPRHGARGRPRHRQHQARRDPVRRARARPGPARGRRRRDGQAPDARPDRRPPARDTGGDFGVSGASANAWAAGFQGLVKTVAQEWPAAHAKAIDVDAASDVDATDEARAARIVAELLEGGDELEVGLRADGSRVALRSVPAAPVVGAAPFARDAVIVATGGARGVTAHTLLALARAYGGRYVLLGRTPHEAEGPATAGAATEPALKKALLVEAQAKGEKVTPADINKRVARVLANREVSKTLAGFAALGTSATYLAVDVNDGERVAEALAQVRRTLGPIAGLVHGAGVLADKLVADKTVEQWRSVYSTKVKSLATLLEALRGDPLQLLVMFASVAGRCGNRGQSDYAVANEVLAKVAAREAATRPGCVVKALQWGPWEGGMVTPELARQFHAMGVPLIPLDVGARMLVEEVADHTGRVEIVLGNEPVMGPLAGHAPGAPAPAAPAKRLRVRVGPDTHPQLRDHTVAGVPVAPIVLALEWFARAAAAARPDLAVVAVEDVKVLRGIKLDRFDDGEWFDVSAREVSNGHGAVLQLELSRVGGPLHYTARAVLAPELPAAPAAAAAPSTGAFTGPIYDGQVLFHGPAFQMLSDVAMGDAGMSATVAGTTSLPWSPEPWATDPAAMDGGLQMALLWTRHALGRASLPMGVGAFKAYRGGPATGPSRAVLRGETRGKDRTVSAVAFVDAAGRTWAELVGIEAVLRPQ
jgi:NADP-dependent 3-hydroxy acid dehydrogenase YdfG